MEVLLHELTSVPNGAKLFHILTTDVKQQGRREKNSGPCCRGAQIFQNCRNHIKILGDMKQVQRQDPQILGDAV